MNNEWMIKKLQRPSKHKNLIVDGHWADSQRDEKTREHLDAIKVSSIVNHREIPLTKELKKKLKFQIIFTIMQNTSQTVITWANEKCLKLKNNISLLIISRKKKLIITLYTSTEAANSRFSKIRTKTLFKFSLNVP